MNELHYVPTEEEMDAAEEEALTWFAIAEAEQEIEWRLEQRDGFHAHFAYDLVDLETAEIDQLRQKIKRLQG